MRTNIYISGVKNAENEPVNIIKEFCKQHKINNEQFFGTEPIIGSFTSDCEKVPEGFNPVITKGLHLPYLKKLPKKFTPTVGHTLFLHSLERVNNRFRPNVGDILVATSLREPTKEWDSFILSQSDNWGEYEPKYYDGKCKLNIGGIFYRPYPISAPNFRKIRGKSSLIELTKKYIIFDGVFYEVVSKKCDIWKIKNVESLSSQLDFLIFEENGKIYIRKCDHIDYRAGKETISDKGFIYAHYTCDQCGKVFS